MKQSLDTRTKLLTKNPISLMIELSIPAVLGMVVVGLYNMMDSIFVGQMVGAAQMGAVSVSYPIYFDKCKVLPQCWALVPLRYFHERLVKKMKERSKRLWEIWWQWYFYCQ